MKIFGQENRVNKIIGSQSHIIILSPHLDDAVWSCGGLISKATKKGCKVDVITVYTGEPEFKDLPKLQTKEITKKGSVDQRKKEDKAALNLLNACAFWWNIPTRLLRKPWLNKRTDVFKTPPGNILLNTHNYKKIKEKTIDLLTANPDSYIFSPMGIGNLYDHIELFAACVNAGYETKSLNRIVFYEDAYSFITKNREKHFLLKGHIWNKKDAPEKISLMWRIIAKVMATAASECDFQTYIPKQIDQESWIHETLSIEKEFELKMEALSKYESQMNQFGGIKKIKKLMGKYHDYYDKAEPYWYLEN